MPRLGLLALTPDDLAALSNRGTVKRAQRELEEGSPTCQIEESPDGELVFRWSDGVTCHFRAGDTVHSAVCSSGVTGVSRHIVRSVLAYQQHCAISVGPVAKDGGDVPDAGAAEPGVKPVAAVWDPGGFTDDDLIVRFRRPAVAKARQRFEQGVLVELARGEKPVARFLDTPCTVRFPVPGDLRYATADCAEPLLSTYVPMAVWAFRELPAARPAGLVALQQADVPVPADLLDELHTLLIELQVDGITGCGAPWSRKLARIEGRLREAGLVWPAELAADLAQQHERYHAHDAGFDPLQVVQTAGELVARSRAIRRDTKRVPQTLIRGTRSDCAAEIAGARLIGLGAGVRLGRRVTTLVAYLHDVESGNVVGVERSFADPPPDSGQEPKNFCDLAETVLARGVSLGSLAALQILIKSGKRTPGGRLILPRGAGSLGTNPQAFAWEQLKTPTAVESFAQLAARLEALPPSYLRPRRLTEDLHVCPIDAVEETAFDAGQQRLIAVLRDRQGGRATLVHPFHSRARAGFENLRHALEHRGEQLRFVCGLVQRFPQGLLLRPITLVFADGERRFALQPWIDGQPLLAAPTDGGFADSSAAAPPLQSYCEQLQDALAEIGIAGLRRCDHRGVLSWNELATAGERLGFVKLVAPVRRFAELLKQKAETVHWDAAPSASAALELCLYSRIAADNLK